MSIFQHVVQTYEWSDGREEYGRGYIYEWKGTSAYVYMYRKCVGGSRRGVITGLIGRGKGCGGWRGFEVHPIISIPLLTAAESTEKENST